MTRRLSQAKTLVQKRLPTVSRPVAAALLFALTLLAGIAIVTFTGSVPPSSVSVDVWTVASLLVLVIVLIGSYLLYRRDGTRAVEHWERLSSRVRALIAGAGCGTLVAIGLGVATLAGAVPLVFVPVGSLVAWPVAAVWTLRQRSTSNTADSPSVLESLLITAGYAQVKQLQTRVLAGLVGFAGAVLGGIGLHALLSWLPWFDVTLSLLQTAVVTVCLWLLATVIVYNHYEAAITDRTDLHLVTVSRPELRDGRELTIKNDGTAPVELARAKLRDTNRDCYQFDVGVTLEPGACCSFAVPASFSLEPNDAATALPLGYTLTQGSKHPTLYTRDGEQFVLQGETEPRDRDSTRDTTRQPVGLDAEPTPQE